MCLTIPARVVEAAGQDAVIIGSDGRKMEVSSPFLTGLCPGDWVLHMNGLVIRKIPPEDAAEILSILEGGRAKERPVTSPDGAPFGRAIGSVLSGQYTKDDIITLLASEGEEMEALFDEAERTKRASIKDFICVHGIIEFSNRCERDCLYCGLRAGGPAQEGAESRLHGPSVPLEPSAPKESGLFQERDPFKDTGSFQESATFRNSGPFQKAGPFNSAGLSHDTGLPHDTAPLPPAGGPPLPRYRMAPEEIIETAVSAVKDRGFKLLVLQSGEDRFYTSEMLAGIRREIKARARVFIFISAGERGPAFYRTLREAGASGALLRFETSSPRLFRRLHPGAHAPSKDLDNRLSHLAFLRDLGYYIATGSLTGLPGQSLEDIAGDILLTKKWANMVSTGPFLPSPGTPLGASPRPDPDLYLKTVAVTRLVMKKARIPVVTAFETLEGPGARKKAFSCGANSLMINLTPRRYRDLYALYPGKAIEDEEDDVFVRNGLFRYEGSFKMLEEKMLSEFIPPDNETAEEKA